MAVYREVNSLAFKDTELTLGLPGSTSIESTSESDSSSGLVKNSTNCKRGFIETVVVDSLCSNPHTGSTIQEDGYKLEDNKAKIQVIGWPPVRSLRKKEVLLCKYVKVGADGAPYLRKIDLQMCTCYQELLRVLHQMFNCFTLWGDYLEQSKAEKGMEYYVPTYEDRDGDLLLVGDVPWKMFIDSCKRIRLMRSSEANGLAP